MLKMATTHHVPIYRWLYIVSQLTQLDCQYQMLPACAIHSTESCLLAALATFIWWSNFRFSLVCLTWFFSLIFSLLVCFSVRASSKYPFVTFISGIKRKIDVVNIYCEKKERKKRVWRAIPMNKNEFNNIHVCNPIFSRLKQLNGYIQMETCNVYTEKERAEVNPY